MKRFRRRLAVVILLASAWLWWRDSSGPGELSYRGTVERPTWRSGGPAVLIDNAHWNVNTARKGLVAFAGLLEADGYSLAPPGNAARAETLMAARVAVIANPLGLAGLARRLAERVHLDDLALFDDDALLGQEIETTIQWVENGGSLLLAVDEHPMTRGSRGLAEALGVGMRGRLVVDVGHSEPRFPERLRFSRENGLLGTHPIVDGFPGAPPVNRVVTFGGQALVPPPGAAILLLLSPSATDVAHKGDPAANGESVHGLGQAVAFERGRGRVVVIGDVALLTMSEVGDGQPVGLSWAGTNNERFVRYVMRWLSRRDDPPAAPR
ncbi:MAG: hypothetical protein ABI880_01965 [Acidobacteriota bacterium]